MARDASHDHHHSSSSHVKHETEDSMPSTSDFVKKLYKMLEDTSFSDVVSWGPNGDCFVVKDMNEFTKSILPRMFKHSNFASFVRQLNKYDFHKVKNTDDNQFGEHSWTFRHPDFHADRRDALENIKRKVPAARKSTGRGANSPSPASSATVEALQAQIDRMARDQEEMAAHIRSLETNYQNVLSEMVNFQRNMAQQDGLMQNLIQYFLQLENGKVKTEQLSNPAPGTYAPDPNPFLPATEAQRMMGAYPDGDIARASLAQMNEISRRAEVAGMTFSTSSGASGGPPRPSSRASTIMAAAAGLMPGGVDAPARPMSRQDALARIEELSRMRPTPALDQTQTQTASQAQAQGQTATATSASASASGAASSSPVSQEARGQAAAQQASSSSSSSQQQQQQSSTRTSSQTIDSTFDPSAFLMEDAARYGLSVDPNSLNHEGLQVFTVGHLLPRSSLEDANGNWAFDPNALSQAVVMPTPEGMGGDPEEEGESSSSATVQPTQFLRVPTPPAASGSGPSMASSSTSGGSAGPTARPGSAQTLRVRRSTYVPGWAVPPRVLLVDDDAVSRKVSSKFLQIFGCTIDVAVDGVGAVNKMNLEKYDLVLMDIVMPKLDGVSATSLIRQFDHMTPIISMTSNSKPAEIMKYYSSGMNDHLPKPFTQHGLWEVLEKHLTHLKVIQTLSRVPRSVGVPPLSDPSFDNALAVQASAAQAAANSGNGTLPLGFSLGGEDDEGKINPLAGMGLTDEQYTLILQNLVNNESFAGVGSLEGVGVGVSALSGCGGAGGSGAGESSKRPLDDASDGREPKRSRFEVIE
ncbi:HSF-type DNA-binding-domain-containing protein [Trametes punicea]|nr:HSF-type DNA-binding-domain-containing protein [Trametes punicea]